MYQLNSFLTCMTEDQINQMEDILKFFYNFSLRSNKENIFLTSGFNMIQKQNKSKKEKFESYSVFIEEYIKTFAQNLYEPDMIKSTSKFIAACILKEPNFLQTFKQGGVDNFVYYIKLSIFESLNRDYTMGLLIKLEKCETIKKITRSKSIELI